MRRIVLGLSLVVASVALVACYSATAPSASKQPAVHRDIVTDSFPSSTCRSGWQTSTGRCL